MKNTFTRSSIALLAITLSGCAVLRPFDDAADYQDVLSLILETANSSTAPSRRIEFNRVFQAKGDYAELLMPHGVMMLEKFQKNLKLWCDGKKGQLTFDANKGYSKITTYCVAEDYPLFVGQLKELPRALGWDGPGSYQIRFVRPHGATATLKLFSAPLMKEAISLGFPAKLDATQSKQVKNESVFDSDMTKINLDNNLRVALMASGGTGIDTLLTSIGNVSTDGTDAAYAICARTIFERSGRSETFRDRRFYFDREGNWLRTDAKVVCDPYWLRTKFK